MSTFDEYAALARQLSVRHQANEQGAAAEADRRRDLGAAVEYLHRRLLAQGQRLDQLGRMIGSTPSAAPPGAAQPVSAPPGFAAPASAPPGSVPPVSAPPGKPGPPTPPGSAPLTSGPPAPSGAAPTSGSPAASHPGPPSSAPGAGSPFGPAASGAVSPGGSPGSGAPRGTSGTGWDGGVAAAPGRPGVGAYPQVGVGEAERALPVAVSATAAGVPGQRAGEVDPATELELARRWADEADRYAQQAELLAQRPALLPTWSPIARAVAVYLGFAAVSVLLMLVMVLASGVGVVGGLTLYAWMCAGLPAVSLIGGWLVLGRWGRPAVGAATGPRYPVLGFLLCFLAVPLAYCGYLIMIRTLR